MSRCRTFGRKNPAFLSHGTTHTQNIDNSMAHRNEPPSFRSLAVWHKDHPVLPIKVLDPYPEEFSFVPHSSIAHQDDDVAEQLKGSRAPFALRSTHKQL